MAGIPATITVDGTDVTDYVNAGSINWKNTVARTSDTLSFTIEDRAGELAALSLTLDNAEVLFLDESGTRLFGGTIKTAKQRTVPRNGQYVSTWVCSAVDFSELLSRGWVVDIYQDMTDAEIIQAVIAEYRPDINATTYVGSSGITFDRFVVNRQRPREVLDNISKATGFTWYVDANKNLRYFSIETYAAPFGISSQPDEVTTFAPIDLDYDVDATNLCNRITVVGGVRLGPDEAFAFSSDDATGWYADLGDLGNFGFAARRNILLPHSLFPPTGEDTITVEVNAGDDTTPSWVVCPVYPDNILNEQWITSNPVLALDNVVGYDAKDRRIRAFTFQFPAGLEQAVRVTGRYEIPTLVRRSHFESHERYGDWFEDKIVDATIRDDVTARAVAKQTLVERAYAREKLTFSIYEHGLRAGQTLHVFDEDKGIDADFVIQSVSPRIDGADVIRYQVEAGERNPDLIDLLIDIRKRQFLESDDLDNVVLSDINEAADTLALAEAYTRFAVTLSAPWFYSPSSQDGAWNRSKWGAAGPGPNAPTGITGTAGNGTLTFDWADQADAAGFYFETGASPTGPFTRLTPTFIRNSGYGPIAASPGTTYANIVAVGFNGVETEAVGSGLVPVNLVRFSQEFDNALWVKTSGTLTANTTVAPDGTTTADRFRVNGFTSGSALRQRVNVTAGQQYTFSFYHWDNSGSTGWKYAVANVNTGTDIVADTAYSPSATWQRVTKTFTVPVGCTQVDLYITRNTASATFSRDLIVWGAQLETGATANAYQTVQ